MIRFFVVACISLVLHATAARAETNPALIAECFDAEPRYYMEGIKVKGLGIELLQYISSKASRKITYRDEITPLARAENNLLAGDIDIILGIGKTPARAQNYVIGESLFEQSTMAVVRKNDTTTFKTLKDFVDLGDRGVVLGVRSASVTTALKSVPGLVVDDAANNIEQALEKLVAERGRVAIYNNVNTPFVMKKPQFAGQLKVADLDFSLASSLVVTPIHHVLEEGQSRDRRRNQWDHCQGQGKRRYRENPRQIRYQVSGAEGRAASLANDASPPSSALKCPT